MIDPTNPAEADQRLLQAIEHGCGVKLSWQGKVLTAKAVKQPLNIPKAQQLATDALKPWSDDAIMRALDRLEGMTGKPKPRSDEAEDATYEGLLAKIRKYPGDIAVWVLWGWDDKHEFWPRWVKLKAELDTASALRRAILPALMDVKHEAEKREPPSQDEIDRVNAIHANFLKRMGASAQKIKPPPCELEKAIAAREAAERQQIERELHPDVSDAAN